MTIFTKSKMNRYSYRDWVAYFARNSRHRLEIDFSQETGLSDREKTLIFPSIRAFQKGEGSSGRHLMKAVEKDVAGTGDQDYREAMLWFIREENMHSAYLKQFLDFYQVEAAGNSVLDQIFRKLRQLGGLRCEVTVLVTAEMTALTYYDALAACTGSPALKSICAQMLHDEIPHVMFQSRTLGRLPGGPAHRLLRILFMEATLLAVWCAFHSVYRAGGYSFARFLRENLGCLHQSMDLSRQGNAQ